MHSPKKDHSASTPPVLTEVVTEIPVLTEVHQAAVYLPSALHEKTTGTLPGHLPPAGEEQLLMAELTTRIDALLKEKMEQHYHSMRQEIQKELHEQLPHIIRSVLHHVAMKNAANPTGTPANPAEK